MNLHISCHLDVVPALRKMTWEVKSGKAEIHRRGGESLGIGVVQGAMDNRVPAAIVLSLLPWLTERGVVVHFTQDEEPCDRCCAREARTGEYHGCKHRPMGAERVARRLKRDPNARVLVVDTDELREEEAAVIEFVSAPLTDTVLSRLPFTARVVVTDPSDPENESECWVYRRHEVPYTGIFMPVHGDYHTPRAWVEVSEIEAFRNALMAVVDELLGRR